jgi:hypothetical protein
MRPSAVALVLVSVSSSLPVCRAAFAQQAAPPAPAPAAPAAPVPPAPPATAAPAPGATLPPAPPSGGSLDLTTLRELLDRGVISQMEYDAAMRDIAPSTGEQRAGDAVSLVFGKWATTFYGFVEGDFIYDSTQSFNDLAGNALVARPNGQAPPVNPNAPNTQETYAGSNGQTQFSVRNTRFGFRLKPPAIGNVYTSALLEMDFLGTQSIGSGTGQVTENAFFTSPLPRIRHAAFRIETPVVDFLIGQYWDLFGWQNVYTPNTVEIQGLPGELYSRNPQIRVSKTIHAYPVTLEVAIAAKRPPSRGSEAPEGEGGVRLALDSWTGMQTVGATGTSIMPASVAFTGDYRRFEVPAIDSLIPTKTVTTSSTSVAADAFLPVLPATKDKRDNALSLTGEFVYGAGIADLYTGLTGGVVFPAIPNNTGLAAVPAWPQNIDNGLVDYDISGFSLHPIQWTTYIVGLQYYLPALGGKVWVSANYSHTQSRDTTFLGNYAATSDYARIGTGVAGGKGVNAAIDPNAYYYPNSTAQVRAGEDWWDANLFYDPVPSVRLGVELAEFIDHYVDGFTATNIRGQFSGFFLF